MTLYESAFGTIQHGKAVTVIQSVIYVLHVCRSRERDLTHVVSIVLYILEV